MISKPPFQVLAIEASDPDVPDSKAKAASEKLWCLVEIKADEHLRCLVTDFDNLPKREQDRLRHQLVTLLAEYAKAEASLSLDQALFSAAYHVYRLQRPRA